MTKMNTPPETPRFGSPEWEQHMREEVRRRGHRNIERDSHRIERDLLASVAPWWQRWAARAFFLLLLIALLFGLKWLFYG